MKIEDINHKISIPEWYLLTIAVHGNMGDGELPDLMKTWAEKECRRLGLADKVKELKSERLTELKRRLTNTLGADFVGDVEMMIEGTMKKLTGSN